MKFGDQENRQNANCEITKRSKRTVDVCHDDDDVDTDAVAFNRWIQGGSGPEV
jgi:hypothetical protein